MQQDRLALFVETQNIAHFRALLAEEANPDKRRILVQLLAEAEEKHMAASRPAAWTE